MNNGVVIIGTGHAGVQAAASLREEGFDGPVTLVGDESDLPYHKPPLSKAFLKDANAKPQVLRAEAFYTGAGIDLRLGSRVAGIDRSARRVQFENGEALLFDRLILATGSRPRLLPATAGLANVLALRTVSDARLIRERAGKAENVVVLGGGFIGLEIAATLSAGGRTVTVIEAQDRLLGRAVAPLLAGHVAERLATTGVKLLTGTTVERFESEAGRIVGVTTSAGERIAADMALVGIGAVPNVELAEAAGLAVGNGIRVDPQMRSSVPEILAIGDAVNFRQWHCGADVRLESVQNATDQARLAVRTIMGHGGVYDSVPWFWSDIGDMKLQMVGLIAGSDRAVLSGEPGENRFSVFHYRGLDLIAIESVNRPADHMLGRKMIAAGYSPTPEELAAGDLKATFARWQEDGSGRAAAE
ncbi:FAD-dependent oxidoreductase [Pseudaminobacter sp. 19-2017]|uniref:FAD-dependent oxidoreductase n=1 Tax=Pseudaminobacter soli (ex Zhang et al. 2022) TaxID=2831468 RepID=A0A942I236_9HYPH|nr:FAD-dependent oxidoreductase [Pseudaminobacter soli]MBS3648992.1 FAD-dependent oxidoreductase [Pseudaminobacter soli]